MMLWVKALHILFVIAWMAGVFYLPRIFVHLVEGREANEDTRRLVIMAGRLLRFSLVMACLAILPGLWLWLYYGAVGGWLYAKLALVVLLIAYQAQSWRYFKALQGQDNATLPGALFFRLYNESALLLVIPILILAVVKPF